MSLGTFERLRSVFHKTRLVYLQGWGEPLLNPNFFTFAEIAKKAGCRVGTTTNGTLLDGETICRILDVDLDIIALSLASTDDRNDTIRKGTSIKKVIDTIRALGNAKAKAGTDKPSIHLAYILLRSYKNAAEALPSFLQDLDISHVAISTLDFVQDSEFQKEVLFPETEEEYHTLRSYLYEISLAGQHNNINISYHLGHAGHRHLTCTENIQKALFISADGTVSPCVFTHIPVSDHSPLMRSGKAYEHMIFGNINSQPLEEIWRRKAYRDFRNSFRRDMPHARCSTCYKLYET